MTRITKGDKVLIEEGDRIVGEVIGFESISKSPQNTVCQVRLPGTQRDYFKIREMYLEKASCGKHQTDTVYSSKRDEYICPFCQ